MSMRAYCEGSNCSRKDFCLLHVPIENTVQEYIDWSKYGSGHYWTDETGMHSEIEHFCGDGSKFKHFEPTSVSAHDFNTVPMSYIGKLVLPKRGNIHSDKCFTQECIEKIIDIL